MMQPHPTVSFDNEPLVLVDEADQSLGYAEKQHCHDGDGVLHRAFSVFLLNDDNQLLLQQRSAQKRLWPGYWSNACCSHPRRGEALTDAVDRRLREELGAATHASFLFKFRYHARFRDLGCEHELCYVYVGRAHDPIQVNVNEISAVRWLSADMLDHELKTNPDQYTPWLKLEWQRIRAEFWQASLATLGK